MGLKPQLEETSRPVGGEPRHAANKVETLSVANEQRDLSVGRLPYKLANEEESVSNDRNTTIFGIETSQGQDAARDW